MPRRRASTAAAIATYFATASQPSCSLALVAKRHGGLGRARAPFGRRRHRWAPALRRRGGGEDDDDEEDDDEDEDEDEDDDDAHLFDDDEDDGAVSDADFEGDSLKARARKAWAATPPVTQVYVGSSLALTVGSFLLAGNQWPQWLNLDWKKVMTGQLWWISGVWRPFTGFLYYGPFGLSYLLTIHFVWTYMGTLEKLQFAEPWDFLVMLLFGAASLLAGVGIGGGNARFLGHNLSCFLVYIWARTYEGQEVAVMEFFTIRAELLPWFFAAQTYLLEHEPPVHDLLGIAIGHSYTVLRQRKRLAAPGALRAVYEARPELMAKYEAFAEEFS